MAKTAPHLRFSEARERRGLSPEQFAALCSLYPIDVWEIEGVEGDLEACFTPKQLQKFSEAPVSAKDLVQLIYAEYRLRGVTLEQFEDVIEWWSLNSILEPPEKLL